MAISQRQGNVASGAAMGWSVAGPWGAFAGGVLGAFGDSGPNATERRKQKEGIAEQAYGVAGQTLSYLSQGREGAHTNYRKEMSSMTAKFAASGASMTGSAWDQNRGNVIRNRDDKLTSLNLAEDEYRGSAAYEEFKVDYRRQFDISDDGDLKRSRVKKGRTGKMFTGAQLKGLQHFERYTPGGTRGKGDKAYKAKGNKYADLGEQYNKMLKPGIRAYELSQFGTDAEKKQFAADMDVRIAEANKWYDRKVKGRQAEEAIRAEQNRKRQAREDKRSGGRGEGPGKGKRTGRSYSPGGGRDSSRDGRTGGIGGGSMGGGSNPGGGGY